jgi:hypothetical protein
MPSPRTPRPLALARVLLTTALLATPGLARAQDDGDAPAALALGSSVPMADVAMRSVGGASVTLAGAAGRKGTLVLFICNHCPWVKAWQSRIAQVGNAAAKQGVGVVAINANDPAAYPEDGFDEMVTRAKQVGYHFPYAVDSTSGIARAFGATHTPEAFLFDAKGRLVYHGAIDDNAQHADAVRSRWLADAVGALAAGRPVATAETRALGCSIKYRAASRRP